MISQGYSACLRLFSILLRKSNRVEFKLSDTAYVFVLYYVYMHCILYTEVLWIVGTIDVSHPYWQPVHGLTLHVQSTIVSRTRPSPRVSLITQELPGIISSFLISYHTLHNLVHASYLLFTSSFPFRPSKSSQRLQILIHPPLGPNRSTKRHSRDLKENFKLRRQPAVDAR